MSPSASTAMPSQARAWVNRCATTTAGHQVRQGLLSGAADADESQRGTRRHDDIDAVEDIKPFGVRVPDIARGERH
jgi:hypothetical protein